MKQAEEKFINGGFNFPVDNMKKHNDLILNKGQYFDRQIWEMFPGGAYACNAEGLITWFNKSAAKIWGKEPKLCDPGYRFCGAFKLFETDGSPFSEKKHPMVRALCTNVAVEGYEIIIEQPGGKRLNILAHVNPIHDESGSLVGAVNILEDITEKRFLEKQLQQAQEMVLAGKNASRVGHDLNNVLTAIIGSAEFGLQDLDTNHIAYTHFRQIKIVTDKATGIVGQLLSNGQQKGTNCETFATVEMPGGEESGA